MIKKSVFLIGFMGVGKSVVGKRVAEALKCSFVDTDKMAEEAMSRSIPDVFRHEGEEFFRRVERSVLEVAASKEACIISTGGGAPCYGDNLKFMKSAGLTVTLLATPETIFSRISLSSATRPLLSCENPKERIKNLLQKRAYYYINSDYLIDTEDKNSSRVASEIVKIVCAHEKRGLQVVG